MLPISVLFAFMAAGFQVLAQTATENDADERSKRQILIAPAIVAAAGAFGGGAGGTAGMIAAAKAGLGAAGTAAGAAAIQGAMTRAAVAGARAAVSGGNPATAAVNAALPQSPGIPLPKGTPRIVADAVNGAFEAKRERVVGRVLQAGRNGIQRAKGALGGRNRGTSSDSARVTAEINEAVADVEAVAEGLAEAGEKHKSN